MRIYIRASVLVLGDKRTEYALLFKKRGAGKKVKKKSFDFLFGMEAERVHEHPKGGKVSQD